VAKSGNRTFGLDLQRVQMTDRILRPSIVAHLPDPPAGMFDIAYGITAAGTLALMRSDCDVCGNLLRYPHAWDFRKEFAEGVRARLSVFDGSSESTATEFRLEDPFSIADQLPDGHWVIASRRCGADDENAYVLSSKGDLLRRFSLGDAINHLQCDTSGAIWVGYFDEARELQGLVKFDGHGRALWRSGLDDAEAIDIFDCYALNVDGTTAWSCYYVDFPIVRIEQTRRTRIWRGSLTGVQALAVDHDLAFLAGGYEEKENRLVLVDLSGEEARVIEQFRFDVPESADAGARLFQARNQTLHIVRQGVWRAISVADVVAA
jgi:hypothetical protein